MESFNENSDKLARLAIAEQVFSYNFIIEPIFTYINGKCSLQDARLRVNKFFKVVRVAQIVIPLTFALYIAFRLSI